MKIVPERRLFWFLKKGTKLDLSKPWVLDMYVQQTITRGRAEDIRNLFGIITPALFKESLSRIKAFLPFEVRKFWEDALGDT